MSVNCYLYWRLAETTFFRNCQETIFSPIVPSGRWVTVEFSLSLWTFLEKTLSGNFLNFFLQFWLPGNVKIFIVSEERWEHANNWSACILVDKEEKISLMFVTSHVYDKAIVETEKDCIWSVWRLIRGDSIKWQVTESNVMKTSNQNKTSGEPKERLMSEESEVDLVEGCSKMVGSVGAWRGRCVLCGVENIQEKS